MLRGSQLRPGNLLGSCVLNRLIYPANSVTFICQNVKEYIQRDGTTMCHLYNKGIIEQISCMALSIKHILIICYASD